LNAPPVSVESVGLYVHYPYCEKKCPYCDFNVHVIAHDDSAYADAVIAEIEARAPQYGSRFSTLYFGGGTPSEWDPAQTKRVIDHVRPMLASNAEITLESNPGTIAEQRIHAFAAAGINRFSIGAQSFHDHELEILGRTHSAREVTTTVVAAQKARARVSLDLIYALPGQTIIDVERSIGRAAELGVDHISAYTLTVEPTTPLARRVDAGTFEVMPDDEQAEMIEAVTARLESFRYFRYEVSSYAPPGLEAVHNSIYWIGGPYLGVGAGAHSYLPLPYLEGATRRESLRSPNEYIEDARARRFSTRFEEKLSKREVLGDRLMVGVRTKWGFDLSELAREARMEEELAREVLPVLETLVKNGLLEREALRFRPTPKGFFFADFAGRKLLASVKEDGG
jgi:oxygen-independent coproporphyrinogen-3 oxidase